MTDKHTSTGEVSTERMLVPVGETPAVLGEVLAGELDEMMATEAASLAGPGSKALTRGIPAVFGRKAVIQRCRLHKERNVLDHLPDPEHASVRRKLRSAWSGPDDVAARAELEALARALQRKHPGAASSLREGLEKTLTVTRLGIDGTLLKTVFSTNPVESMIEIVREPTVGNGLRASEGRSMTGSGVSASVKRSMKSPGWS